MLIRHNAPVNDQTTTVVVDTPQVAKPVPAWAIHRRMYDWVLSFAHHKHSTTALFCLSFVESSFFPIPPDVLLAPLCMGNRKKSFWFATVCTVASVLGAFLGYWIGYALLDYVLMIPKITQEGIDEASKEFAVRGSWYVITAAFTPIPFKLLTITAGIVQMSLLPFAIACVIGRGARFYAEAMIIYFLGDKAKPLIERYFNLFCIICTLLIIGVYALMKWMDVL